MTFRKKEDDNLTAPSDGTVWEIIEIIDENGRVYRGSPMAAHEPEEIDNRYYYEIYLTDGATVIQVFGVTSVTLRKAR